MPRSVTVEFPKVDTLATRLEAIPRTVSDSAVNLFADNVLLNARTVAGIQRLLDLCSKRAKDHDIHWALGARQVLSTNKDPGGNASVSGR